MREKNTLSISRAGWLIAAVALILSITSCTKSSSNNNNVQFTGTYAGSFTSSTYNEADTIVIPASSNSSIVMTSKTSLGSTYSINGTVSGSNLTIPSQSVYIANLGASYTVSGTGTLSNKTLVINYVFVSPSNVTTNWTFTGDKL